MRSEEKCLNCERFSFSRSERALYFLPSFIVLAVAFPADNASRGARETEDREVVSLPTSHFARVFLSPPLPDRLFCSLKRIEKEKKTNKKTIPKQ